MHHTLNNSWENRHLRSQNSLKIRVGFLDRRSFRWIEQKKYNNFGPVFLRAEWIFLVRSKSPMSFSYWSCGQKYEKVILEFFGSGFLWYKAADSDFLSEYPCAKFENRHQKSSKFGSRIFGRDFNMFVESGFHRFLILCFVSEEDVVKVGFLISERWNSLYWCQRTSWKLINDDCQSTWKVLKGLEMH